jgi:hypothetical protein
MSRSASSSGGSVDDARHSQHSDREADDVELLQERPQTAVDENHVTEEPFSSATPPDGEPHDSANLSVSQLQDEAVASSPNMSLDAITQLPPFEVDGLQGALWSISIDDTIPSNASEAGQFVESVRREAAAYQSRLLRQHSFLLGRITEHLADMKTQADEVEKQFEEHCANIDKQINGFSTQPQRNKPAKYAVVGAASASTLTAATDSPEAVIKFWKTKYGQIVASNDATAEEHALVRSRIEDLKKLQSTDQFRAIRLLGELRAEESALLEEANGHQYLLAQMQDARTPSQRTPRDTGACNDKERVARDRFSVIEKRIVEAEEAALKVMQSSVDSRVRALKSLLATYTFRQDSLEARAEELVQQTQRAPTASLDKTLQLAMDLRSKIAGPPREDADQLAQLLEQHRADEQALASEVEGYLRKAAKEDDAMGRELRERKVKVIRTIHSSGGSVDARFEHVRAQQHVSAIGQQVSAAESDRVNLKLRLASACGQAQRNMDFLSQVRST